MPTFEQEKLLLERLKAGDSAAFDQLYSQHRNHLKMAALYLLQDEAEAQDLVQEFFIDLWQKQIYQNIHPSPKGTPFIRNYLHKIIANRCKNRLKIKNTREQRMNNLPLTGTTPSPEHHIVHHEQEHHLRTALNAAMAAVPPLSAKVFRLSYMEQKSRQEVADLMGISPHTVKNQLARALKYLRAELKTSGVFCMASFAIVIIIGIGLGVWGWWNIHRSSLVQIALSSAQLSPVARQQQITLQLNNGKIIDLSRSQPALSAGYTRLNNTGQELSFINNGSYMQSGMNHLNVPPGRSYQLSLSDGTKIWINADTQIDFPFVFTGNTREISIKGEAYLQVAADNNHPFLVHTPHGTVRVLGTRFNVNTYDTSTVKIALVEGAVSFKGHEQTVHLRPGKEAVYTRNRSIQVRSFNADTVLGWRSGKYYFLNTRLSAMMEVLERCYGVAVKIDEPQLAQEPFAGVLDRNKHITVFLNNLRNTGMVNYYFDKDSTLLHIRRS